MEDVRWHLVFMDGRVVAASSPASFFEGLRQSEPNSPADLGRYLDLLRSRGAIGFGVELDVGASGCEINARCTQALSSLIAHGWVRLSVRRSVPSQRQGARERAARSSCEWP